MFENRPYLEALAGDDEALARQAGQDAVALTELYRRYVDRVYRYLLIRVSDVYEAQKLATQTFGAARDEIDRYQGQGKGSFAAWLLGIARRVLADYSRRERDTSPEKTAISVTQSATGGGLQLEQVMQALRAMPGEQAEALALRVFAGLSAAEAGQVMGKSEAEVKQLVLQAVRGLQTRPPLKEEADGWIEIEMRL